MTCPARLHDGTLTCQRTDTHGPLDGHIYHATTDDLGHGKGSEGVSDQ